MNRRPKILIRDYVGRRVRTLRKMGNGYGSIPAGTECRVRGTWRSGVSIETDPCPHCGMALYISQVHRNDVALLEDPKKGLPDAESRDQ